MIRLQQWELMASNGRAVGDLSRTELENLIIESHQELTLRSKQATKLKQTITQLQTRI